MKKHKLKQTSIPIVAKHIREAVDAYAETGDGASANRSNMNIDHALQQMLLNAAEGGRMEDVKKALMAGADINTGVIMVGFCLCMSVCIDLCMYVCMYACMHVCVPVLLYQISAYSKADVL